jgi:hypothetical protein
MRGTGGKDCFFFRREAFPCGRRIRNEWPRKMRKGELFACAGSTRCRLEPWGDSFEDGIQMADDVLFSTDHQTVAAIRSPHSAAGGGVDVMDALGFQVSRATNVIVMVRVAAVDYDRATSRFLCARPEVS